MTPVGIYIHIPFCIQKCDYCDFVSYADKFQFLDKYVDALEQEWEFYINNQILRNYAPITLYIGGGTPSVATSELIELLTKYGTSLRLSSLTEVTIEVNPGTVTAEQLQALRKAGITRLSIGIQSFDNEELGTLGRIHSREDALTCFRNARDAGFDNISIDLIFGIPTSTLRTWESSLQHALDLHPEHISMYNLTVEENTPFSELQQQGRLQVPEEALQLEMYELGIQRLTDAGYEQYEISNFACLGYRSIHNQIYWRNEEYIGIGTGAHSYLRGRRYWNTPDVITYIVKSFEAPESYAPYPGAVVGEEHLDGPAGMGETVMMNLRMMEGVDLTAFEKRFGKRLEKVYSEAIAKLTERKLIEIQNNYLQLTRRGLYVSNEVFQEFLPDTEG